MVRISLPLALGAIMVGCFASAVSGQVISTQVDLKNSTEPAVAAPTTIALQGQQSASSAPRFVPRLYGGLLNDYVSTGFAFGGGVARALTNRPEMEIQGDVLFGRFGSYLDDTLDAFDDNDIFDDVDLSSTHLAISGSFIYNFFIPDMRARPFAGGGIGFVRRSYKFPDFNPFTGTVTTDDLTTSNAGIQILGGIELPFQSGQAFRAELRFGHTYGNAVTLLAGISF